LGQFQTKLMQWNVIKQFEKHSEKERIGKNETVLSAVVR
jgi:hypothetical protein